MATDLCGVEAEARADLAPGIGPRTKLTGSSRGVPRQAEIGPRALAEQSNTRLFAVLTLTFAAAACVLAGSLPLGVSIVTVFLFAGPHNWMEARYMMGRMPGRWGKLRPFFLLGIGGVLSLAAFFTALPWAAAHWRWQREEWLCGLAAWNTALVAWIVALAQLRSRQHPRRDWGWVVPAGFALIALAWLWPQAWDLGLVYAHPLVALWFVDRELGARRSPWRTPYRRCLAVLPVMLGLLWWQLADAPNLPGDDALSSRIAAHAGAGLLSGVSTHLLVATHVFLETLHYGVWLVIIPLASLKTAPWQLSSVPLARRSKHWRRGLTLVLGVGAAASLALWAGFLSNYPLTRDLYFTVALLHVLAEVPFLLRLL